MVVPVRGDADVHRIVSVRFDRVARYYDADGVLQGSPVCLLDDQHGYVFLTVGGNHLTPGVSFRLSFGSPVFEYGEKPWVWCVAGDVVPIPPKQSVWIEAYLGSYDGAFVVEPAQRDILVWCTPPGYHPPVFRRPYLRDELVTRLSSADTGLKVDGLTNFFTFNSDWAGLALRCELMLEGGMLANAGTAVDCPLELIYTNYLQCGEVVNSYKRVWLFPGLPTGYGAAYIRFNLPYSYAARGYSGKLSVRNSAAATAAKAYNVSGGVYVGHCQEAVQYPSSIDYEPSAPGTDWFLSLCVTRQEWSGGPNFKGLSYNKASVGDLRVSTYSYVPTVRSSSGAGYSTQTAQDAAPLTSVVAITPYGEHVCWRWRYLAAATGPAVVFNASVR